MDGAAKVANRPGFASADESQDRAAAGFDRASVVEAGIRGTDDQRTAGRANEILVVDAERSVAYLSLPDDLVGDVDHLAERAGGGEDLAAGLHHDGSTAAERGGVERAQRVASLEGETAGVFDGAVELGGGTPNVERALVFQVFEPDGAEPTGDRLDRSARIRGQDPADEQHVAGKLNAPALGDDGAAAVDNGAFEAAER